MYKRQALGHTEFKMMLAWYHKQKSVSMLRSVSVAGNVKPGTPGQDSDLDNTNACLLYTSRCV